jgi:hypothetical protein
MGKWDQGLGTIGLIGLALALTALITIGVPISVSEDTVAVKDWLGFAGNILGALVTLVAAYVAWRAVQNQIRTERNATLLEVTSREEDRLEVELHAISAFEDLYLLTVGRHAPMHFPDDYAAILKEVGLSPLVSETRAALQAHVAGTIPPKMLDSFANKYANLTNSVELRDRQISTGPEDLSLVELIMQWESEIESEMVQLKQRKELISGKLLPTYRSVIEKGLSVLHD